MSKLKQGIVGIDDSKGVASIPAGGPIVDNFFSTVSGSVFYMYMISTRT